MVGRSSPWDWQYVHRLVEQPGNIELRNAYVFGIRQSLTRKIANHQMLDNLDKLLNDWFDKGSIHNEGLPTVSFVAERLNVSPHYLSRLLRSLTGLNTQQHIHLKLIDKSKEMLQARI